MRNRTLVRSLRPCVALCLLFAGFLLLAGPVHFSGRTALAQAQTAETQADTEEAGAPSDTGFYMNPLWLILMMVAVGAWLFAMSWVYEDAVGVGAEPEKWTSILAGAGIFTIVFAFLVHAALFALTLAAVAGIFVAYVKARNQVVPTLQKLFGPEHRKRILEKLPFGGFEAAGASTSLPLTVSRKDGTGLELFVDDHPDLEEAANVACEMLLRSLRARATNLQFRKLENEWGVTVKLDGVRHKVESLEGDLGGQVASVLAWLMKNEEEGKKNNGAFFAEVAGMKPVQISARSVKISGRPGILVSMPDWQGDLYEEGLQGCGMQEDMAERVEKAFRQDTGCILATGPEDAGVSTTYFAMTRHIDIFTNEVIYLTEESPHEFQQIRVRNFDPEGGETFEKAYEKALRDEPHILMYDELAGDEPGQHLLEFAVERGEVLSTVRAPSAAEALVNLAKEDVDPAVLADAMLIVVNQRLIRTLCDSCKEPVEELNPRLLKKLNIDPQDPGTWYKPVGCEDCMQTGYNGRTGIFEMLIVTDAVKKVLRKSAKGNLKLSPRAIKNAAGKQALRTMQQDGLQKVKAGLTTLDELRRILGKS